MRGVLTEITPSGLINTEAVRFEGCPGKYGRFEMITSYHETAEVMSRFDHEMRRRYERIAPSFDPFLPNKTPSIKKVIFNDPATIVIWSDDTKTVVKCQPGDTYSKELGLAMCISKKFLGNKGNFNEEFKKWIPEETRDDYLSRSCDTCKYEDRGFIDKPCVNCKHNGGDKNNYKERKTWV